MDIVSYLMGKAAGGGGSGGSDQPAIWVGGYEGDAIPSEVYNRIVRFSGLKDKYLLLSFLTRSDPLNLPSGLVQLDKTTVNDGTNAQYVYVYKYHVTTNDTVSLSLGSNTHDRKAIAWWIIDRDFSLTKTATSDLFEYYIQPYSLTTTELTFITFSAYTAQTNTALDVWVNCDGAWVNHPYITLSQLRHFSAIIPPASVAKTTKIMQGSNGDLTANRSLGQVVVYTITV